jgi:hypothetical protein
MFAKPPFRQKYGRHPTPLARAAHRHRFLLGSLTLHVGLLWTLAQWHSAGVVESSTRALETRIQASTQAAERHGMRRRVDSLKAMKELMERIERAQQEPDAVTPEATLPMAQTPSATAQTVAAPAVQTPQEMLAQARALRDRIQQLEQAARAKQMAEVLKISEPQALEQIKQQARQQGQEEPALTPGQNLTDEQVNQSLEHYESQARESLQRRQQQVERQTQGTQLTQSGASGAVEGVGAAHGSNHQAGQGKGQGDSRHSDVVDTKPRRYDAALKPLPLDMAKLRLGHGNVIGSSGAFANRVFVDRWYVIGPFHAANPSTINKIYPPELLVDLDAVYLGKGKRVVRWQYLSSAAYPLIPPTAAEQAMYYGYTELSSDQARDVWMSFGADDDAKAWLNDKLVWVSGNEAKRWYTPGGFKSLRSDVQNANLIEVRRLVHLRKGRNTVLFKLYNNPLDVFFSLVLEPAFE